MVAIQLTPWVVGKFIVSSSVSSVIRTFIKSNVVSENVIGQTQIWIAGMALGGLAGEAAADRIEKKILEFTPFIQQLNEKLTEAQSQ